MSEEYFRKRIMMMNYGDFLMYAGLEEKLSRKY